MRHEKIFFKSFDILIDVYHAMFVLFVLIYDLLFQLVMINLAANYRHIIRCNRFLTLEQIDRVVFHIVESLHVGYI